MKKLILLTILLLPLVAFSQTQLGSDIDGEAASDYSGRSVSIDSDGSHVAIGANGNDGNGTNAGHVRVLAPYGVNGYSPDTDLSASSLTTSGATAAGVPSLGENGNICRKVMLQSSIRSTVF